MGKIRKAIANFIRSKRVDDKRHPRFLAGYLAGMNDARLEISGAIDAYERKALAHHPLPQDVVDLVIAARVAWDTGCLPDCEATALDKALEAFSSRVPYENEPDAAEGSANG